VNTHLDSLPKLNLIEDLKNDAAAFQPHA